MAGFHRRAMVEGLALNEKVSATPRSHMEQGARRKLTSAEADHIGPGLNATTASSPVRKSFILTTLFGFWDFRKRAVCNAIS
jgi:hypothetical protein